MLEPIELLLEDAWLLNTSHLICRFPVWMKIPLTSLRPREALYLLEGVDQWQQWLQSEENQLIKTNLLTKSDSIRRGGRP